MDGEQWMDGVEKVWQGVGIWVGRRIAPAARALPHPAHQEKTRQKKHPRWSRGWGGWVEGVASGGGKLVGGFGLRGFALAAFPPGAGGTGTGGDAAEEQGAGFGDGGSGGEQPKRRGSNTI